MSRVPGRREHACPSRGALALRMFARVAMRGHCGCAPELPGRALNVMPTHVGAASLSHVQLGAGVPESPRMPPEPHFRLCEGSSG